MPKLTQDRLVGYAFQILREAVPESDERGNVIHNGAGEPKLQEQTLIVLVDQGSGHSVVIPFAEQAKQELIRQLTGGIVVPGG